jgi:putative ABC transport system substrate-binding protein
MGYIELGGAYSAAEEGLMFKIRRRKFITLLGGAAVSPFAANAQQAGKLFGIGYLSLLSGDDSNVVLQRLHELGYSEGKNLRFDQRSADGRAERLPQLAAELVRTGPDVLIAGFGTLAAQATDSCTAAKASIRSPHRRRQVGRSAL